MPGGLAPPAGLRLTLLKAAGLATAIGGAAALVWGSGLARFLTRETLKDLTAGLGVLAPVAFFGIKIGAIVLASPSAPLSLLGGALLARSWGRSSICWRP